MTAVLALAAAGSGPADNDRLRTEGWYVTGLFAPMIPDENNILYASLGTKGALGVGRLFREGRFRVELEGTARSVKITGLNGAENAPGRLNARSVFVNVIYTFRPGTAVNPYVGWGPGYSQQRYRVTGITDEQGAPFTMDDYKTSFAQHYIAGVDFALARGWYAHTEFRYFTLRRKTLEASFGTWTGIERSYQFGAGLSYRFGG